MSDPSAANTSEISGSTPKPRKEFRHPALEAMGIPRIRVPSRNWMIFWAVSGSITGLYVYDRRERRKIREQWKEKVSYVAKQKMEPTEMPRKVTVYVAPPPGDYLEEGFAHFRQYIKPILTAAAIDYTVKSAKRQGEIRSSVAEELRNVRRAELGLPLSSEDDQDELDKFIQSKVHKSDEPGGVICIGRGAFKEYINGLHEGWLGPLDPPAEVVQSENQDASPTNLSESSQSEFPDKERDMKDIFGELKEDDGGHNANDPVHEGLEVGTLGENISQPPSTDTSNEAVSDDSTKSEEAKENSNDQAKEKKEKKVPKPYIKIPEYESLETPAEFEKLATFEPMAAIGQPHLLGFLNTPFRIYRFFNRRKLADEMGRATATVVFGQYGPFDLVNGENALIEEENDWPSKWKKKGRENNSEWMRDFKVDERIGNKLTVYKDSEPQIINSYGDTVTKDM